MIGSLSKRPPEVIFFAAIAATIPLLTFFAPRALAPLAVVAAAVALGLALYHRRSPLLAPSPVVAILGVLCVWVLLSGIWASDTWLAVRGAAKLGGGALAGILVFGLATSLGSAHAGIVRCALAGGVALAAVMLAVEVMFSSPLSTLIRDSMPAVQWYGHFWLNPCASVISLLVWPVAWTCWRRYHPIAAVVVLAAVALIDNALGYTTAAGAIAIGAVAAAGVGLLGRRASIFIGAAFVVVFLAAPLVPGRVIGPETIANASSQVKQAVTHRLHIWQFAAERIAENPVRGWGMNASRTIPGGKESAHDPVLGSLGENLPLHPHNIMLQVWLELGVPGAVLLALLGFTVILRLGGAATARLTASLRMGQLVTALVISSASYSAWSSWWLAALWLSTAIAAIVMRDEDPPTDGAGRMIDSAPGGG